MNFFICNRYETKNEDIYLIRRSKNPTKKSYYYEEEYYDSILNPEKTFILSKNDNQKPETESLDNSDELQIIEYPYKHQQSQNNLKKCILNKAKTGRSFINDFQYFAKISNMNINEEKQLKKDLNKNSSNACLSTNFERNVDDRLLSDDFEFDLEDTIKGEDNINFKKLNMENKNNNNSYFYPVLNKEKKINDNNLEFKNPNDKSKSLNNIPKSYKSNFNTNKKEKKPKKKKIEKRKILHPSKSFRKDSENNVNKYRNLNLFNKNLTNNFNKNIKNKNKNKSNIYNKKKEFNWIFSKSLNTNKSTYTDISYTHRNLNKYKKEKLNHKKLSGYSFLTCGTNTNTNTNTYTNEIKNKKLNDNYDFDIANIIKEKFKKKIINSHFLKKGKLNEKENNNYSTKEVIRQFRHYKRKYLP